MGCGAVGIEAKDLKLHDKGNAKPLEKFEQVFWRRLVSWYAEWIGMAREGNREHLGSFVQ